MKLAAESSAHSDAAMPLRIAHSTCALCGSAGGLPAPGAGQVGGHSHLPRIQNLAHTNHSPRKQYQKQKHRRGPEGRDLRAIWMPQRAAALRGRAFSSRDWCGRAVGSRARVSRWRRRQARCSSRGSAKCTTRPRGRLCPYRSRRKQGRRDCRCRGEGRRRDCWRKGDCKCVRLKHCAEQRL